MKFDITKRLREPPFGTETSERLLMSQAADEIDALRAALFVFDIPDETLEGWDDDETFIALPLANGMAWTITAGAFRNAKAARAALSEAQP